MALTFALRRQAPSPEPTLEERSAAAVALRAYSLTAFLDAAEALEQAANEQEIVATEAIAEVDRLADLIDSADDEAIAARAQATRIRELVGL